MLRATTSVSSVPAKLDQKNQLSKHEKVKCDTMTTPPFRNTEMGS